MTLHASLLDPSHDPLHGQTRHLSRLLSHTGETHGRQRGRFAVVPAHYREVPGHVDTLLSQQAHCRYGSVIVAGLTLSDAKAAIEQQLSRFLESPEVSLNVFAYNSKVYYIITAGAGLGDNVVRVPVTGNETVLDAISQVNGLQPVSSKRIWIARPVPGCSENLILPVDWCAVSGRGARAPGGRIRR